ncbi:MAG: polysulfide reductase NrfD [Mailhella sp.]|nr:polysulfide reductase NrfD [Mailhella sp.]
MAELNENTTASRGSAIGFLLRQLVSFPKTPGNILTLIIFGFGLIVTVLRFTVGFAPVSNISDNNPWGIWIGFDLMCGVALAAGGYTCSSACYLLGFKRYHSAVRPAIATAFLGYLFVVIALLYDVGKPWHLPYPLMLSFGTTSILFEVGLCVCIYLCVLFIEWSPVAMEWLITVKEEDTQSGIYRFLNKIRPCLKWLRKGVLYITIPLTVFGVVLSTMHQSSLGSLFLIAPSKLHPLWYSAFLPVFFFVSSIMAGLSMVIFEGTLAHKGLHHKMDETHLAESDGVVLGLGRACSVVLAGYFMMKIMDIAMDNDWHYLFSGWGAWFMFEMIVFVALPCLLYAMGARERKTSFMRWGAVLTVLGIVMNRFNVGLIAFNWQLPSADRYFPGFLEIMLSVFIVTCIVTAYRFMACKMPLLREFDEFKAESH